MTPDQTRPIRLAEFAALRAEITTFLSLQGQFMSYSIALGGGILAFLAKDSAKLPAPGLLAFLVSPFLIFGILYGDVELRILRAAHYIETKLRPTLIVDSSPEAVSCLGWESYLRDEDPLGTFLGRANRLRYLVFLLPVTVLLILLILNRSNVQHPYWCELFLAVDVVLLFLLFKVFRAPKIYEKAIREKSV